MANPEDRLKLLEEEIERRLVERFAALRDEFDRLRLEADRRWAGFLDRFEQKFTGIVPPELMPAPAPPQEAAVLGTLPVEAARSLDAADNQVEALHRYLDLCLRYASRAALLVSRGGTVGVWKAVGFSQRGGSDEATRRAALPSGPGSLLARVLEGLALELDEGNEISKALSADEFSRAVVVPIVVKEKISGALYADCVVSDQDRFDAEAVAFLTFFAGLIVDRLAGRKLRPAPALRPLQKAEPAPSAPAPTPAPVPEPEFELAEEPTGPAPRPGGFGTQMMQQPETAAPPAPKPPPPPQFYGLPSEVEEEPKRPTEAPFGHPSRDAAAAAAPRPERPLELASEEAESPVVEGVAQVPTAMASAVAPAAPEPAVAMPPPPAPPAAARPRISTGARRLAGPLAPVEGDERREEARRFAKLLVSEIKLYNEKAVQQGREQGNLYELLKEDIDRSRQMYDERIPEDVRAGSNFFYEELVRILADGRAEALGI